MRILMSRGGMPVVVLLLCVFCANAWAGNTPCSGRKGGVDRCEGELFLCNDGSISASKKSCSALYGDRGQARSQTLLESADGCACSTGTFCTGPQGGVYCLTPSGNKSYKRK